MEEKWILITESFVNELLETLAQRPYKEVATIFAKLSFSVKQYDAPAETPASQDEATES